MAAETARLRNAPVTKALVKVAVYYVILIAIGAVVWDALPHAGGFAESFDLLSGTAAPPPDASAKAAHLQVGELNLAVTVALAMMSAILLSIPIAWVYVLTRAKKGYQQSVVHLLIVLPLVVSGIVVLVQYSLALAFSLAGIVAAVRFRNTLDDSKDAVYVFLATAVGLSAAVNVPVAAVISILFNITVVTLWYSDFAHSPMELEGSIAEKRLKRARQLARTGTFVARIDDEVFRNMTRQQLEGVAERAWRRANEAPGETIDSETETRIRIRTNDVAAMRLSLEPRLEGHVKGWRLMRLAPKPDGSEVAEYAVQMKKKTTPEDLLTLVRAAGAPHITDAELA
ncbi:MAG: hypothetical protein DMD30_08600 [Gemmatimonadetes bacterium]|nr:MAG: hypothetical protein DMD30_08600 [Gemmatimonadota bacterium]PYP54231.1 MAG: hypothetical protein DMD39_02140 [Gemmatimonadota bacterium]